MTDKLKFRCSGCQKVLNIPAKFRGKKIKCPNCATVFQAGKKPATTEPEPQTAEPLVGPDISLPQTIPAEEASPDLLEPTFENPTTSPQTDSSSQADPFGDLDSLAAPVANVARSHQPVSRREALNRGKQNAKQQDADGLDETDQKVQSAGLFLISLPVIASVLPLMGLQLRRLASAGEFAPLAAMFLGLIGAGCIAYARRKRSDGIPLAGAAAAFVLISGLTGFMVLRTMAPDNAGGGRQANQTRRPTRPSASKATQPLTAQEKRERDRKAEEGRRKRAETAADIAKLERQRLERKKEREEAQQERDRQAAQRKVEFDKKMAAKGASFDEDPFNDPQSSNGEPGSAGSTAADNALAAGETTDTGASKSPFDTQPEPEAPAEYIESIPLEFSASQQRSVVHRKWGSAMMTFAKVRRSKKLEKGLKFAKTIGIEQTTGKLFYDYQPIRGVEAIKIGAMEFVPISAQEDPSDGAIAVAENQRLAGFNLAFDAEGIVGIQGLFVAREPGQEAGQEAGNDAAEPEPGKWLGLETDDVQPAIVKNGASVHGYVFFSKGRNITGFALVYKN